MENVKAELISALPAAGNSDISEPASRLDEKVREEKELDADDLIPYLTFFHQRISDLSPENLRLVAGGKDEKTVAVLSAPSDTFGTFDTFSKGAALQSSLGSTISQVRVDDITRLAAAAVTASAETTAPATAASAKKTAPVTATSATTIAPAAAAAASATTTAPAKTAVAPSQTEIIVSDAFMTAAAEKKGKDVRREVNNVLPHGTPGLNSSPQSDTSVKSKADNLYTQQIRHADQALSSMMETAASSRPEHGETKITYTFRRWDASNRHAVEFTVPKDQLTQPLIMTPTTREVRERIDIARDTPGAPVFSLREEGEQHSNRRNVWRFYDEEET